MKTFGYLLKPASTSPFSINIGHTGPPRAFWSVALRNSGKEREASVGVWWEIKGGDILRLMKCLPVLFTEDSCSAVYRMIGSFLFFKKVANHL